MNALLLAFLLAATETAPSPAELVVSAPVLVYDAADRSACFNCMNRPKLVTDETRLRSLDGQGPDEAFADYLAEGSSEEQALSAVVSGGILRMHYSAQEKAMVATVTYASTRPLTDAEVATLAEYTRGQLLDGIGEGYGQHSGFRIGVWVDFDVMDKTRVRVSQSPR